MSSAKRTYLSETEWPGDRIETNDIVTSLCI